jgi:putative salt-induced outer membrane protein YdiY
MILKYLYTIGLSVLFGSFFHSKLTAAELQFANGDRLTGEVISRADGKIHFRSPILGDLIIAESQAAVMATPETPVESLTGLPPVVEQVQLRDVEVNRAPPPARRSNPWKGKLEFGYQNQSGRNSTLNYSARAELDHTDGANSHRLNARYLYGENKNVLNSDRRDLSFRWRHQISERIFGQTLTSYASDQVARIDHNAEQNVGLGYKYIERNRQTGSVGAGMTVQYREAEGVEEGVAYLAEFFQDYTYKINGRLTFLQSVNALYSPDARARTFVAGNVTQKLDDNAENYKVRINSTLQGKLSERISLNLRYEYEYDNAVLNRNGRTDKRVTSSLGYSF